MDQGQIAPEHRVLAELVLEMALRADVAGEDDQPRGLLVQPLHGAQGGVGLLPLRRLQAPHGDAGEGEQGVAIVALEGDGQEAGRLADHHDVGVEVD